MDLPGVRGVFQLMLRVVLSGAPLSKFSAYMNSDNSTTHSAHSISTYHTLFGLVVALGNSLVALLVQSVLLQMQIESHV